MVFRMKLAKAAKPPIASITHPSIDVCLHFTKTEAITKNFLMKFLFLTEFVDFYENLTL